ncbi:hypothetical protein EDF31_11253 [Curtobacterium sp. PhB142]|uniref:hypothetical protein n=1 Tax=unclassified Curtobacterium TaxID=257496 RepID=UPI0010510B32|nr:MULTISPECIES: hypothetical protein [unclassified Curtobacterium]TCL80535.1 hypothetical protein EDF31_11253 [Curtobacterium sp. PhB142]TCL99775.1 hypothetical protein EDF26_11353 [Curtobacterium sp. PhB134]TDW43078.1 hypothetical protein EDF52_11332 [Curtobacterium sp. PhB42]TDW53624.1 hypothetical protein EDF47_109136 [Curtobacterium sp. PhB190]
MFITYERPTHLTDEQTDPQAPAADLAPGADVDPRVPVCGASTYDVDGTRWTCTRGPGHADDEHRAVFDRYHGGAVGQVAFAWQYEWGGAGHGPSSTVPMTTVTVTVSFPSTAWTNEQLPESIADEVRSVFWECDHDDVTVQTIATSTTHPVAG